MKALTKIESTIVLFAGIAILLQSYINYIEVGQPKSLLIMPISMMVLMVLVSLFADNDNKKIFRKFSIILIIIVTVWFIFVQYMVSLAKAFQN